MYLACWFQALNIIKFVISDHKFCLSESKGQLDVLRIAKLLKKDVGSKFEWYFLSAYTFYLEKSQICLIGLFRRCYIESKDITHKTVSCLQHQFKYFAHFCKLQNTQWHFQYMSVRGMFVHKWNKEPWCHFSFRQKHQLFSLFLPTKLITVYILLWIIWR